MTTQKNTVSIKLNESAKEFFKKMKINMIRVGSSEKALEMSYADLMELIVKYFKTDHINYTKMIGEISKNV